MLHILNPDTKWIQLDQFEAPANFTPRNRAPFSLTAFIDATLSRMIPYTSAGNSLLTEHCSAKTVGFMNNNTHRR
jgi:hypothetical protein